MHLAKKTFLREWERIKARVLDEKRDCCVNPSICSRSCKKEEDKKARASSSKEFKVRTKP